MAFHIRSKHGAPLTAAREQQQFERAMQSGVYNGMQVHHGTTGFRVSLLGGTFCINGVVIFDDADTTDIYDLGSPSGHEHHIIYVTYDGDEPSYHLKSGTFASQAALTPEEQAKGIVLAEIWVPGDASDITDATIVNRPALIPTNDRHSMMSIARCKCVKVGVTFTFHFEDAVIATINPQSKNIFGMPTVEQEIQGDSSGEYGGGYSVTYDTDSSDERIILYVIDPNGFSDTSPLEIRAIGYFAGGLDSEASRAEIEALIGNADSSFTNENTHPYRSDYKNIFILGEIVTDMPSPGNGWLHLSNGIILPLNAEFNRGIYDHLAQSLSSAAYGTGPIFGVGGNINVDDVIVNAATLRGATLDHAYHSFDGAAPPGSGRLIDVNSGAVELKNSTSLYTDPWDAALRVELSTAARANDGDLGWEGLERGIDISSMSGDRNALAYRKRFVWPGIVPNCAISDDGNQMKIDFGLTMDEWRSMHKNNPAVMNSFWVTFPGYAGGDAAHKRYRILCNLTSNYFYLQDVDGIIDIDQDLPGDFGPLPGGSDFAAFAVWESMAQISEDSKFKDISVSGEIHGRGGAAAGHIARRSFSSLGEFISYTGRQFVDPLDQAGHINSWKSVGLGEGHIADGGAWFFSTIPSESISAHSPFVTDGRYIYYTRSSGAPGADELVIRSADNLSLVAVSDPIINSMTSSAHSIATTEHQVFVGVNRTGETYMYEFDMRNGLSLTREDAVVNAVIQDMIAVNENLFFVADHSGGGATYMYKLGPNSYHDWSSLSQANSSHTGVCLDAYDDNIAVITADSSPDYFLDVFDVYGNRWSDSISTTYDITKVHDIYASAEGIFVLANTDEVGDKTELFKFSWSALLIQRVELPSHPDSTGWLSDVHKMTGAYGTIFVSNRQTFSGGPKTIIHQFDESNLNSHKFLFGTGDWVGARQGPDLNTHLTFDGQNLFMLNADSKSIQRFSIHGAANWTRITNHPSNLRKTNADFLSKTYGPILAKPSWIK